MEMYKPCRVRTHGNLPHIDGEGVGKQKEYDEAFCSGVERISSPPVPLRRAPIAQSVLFTN